MRFVNTIAVALAGITAALVFGFAGQGHAASADAQVKADGATAHALITPGDSGWQ